MRHLRFGIEIETIGITRGDVALAIQSEAGGRIGITRTKATVAMDDYRVWNVVPDGSLSDLYDHQAEIVSPILTYNDIDLLQRIVRAVRRAGARVDSTCGIHIHIGAEGFTPKAIRNFVKLVNQQEDLIHAALAVHARRRPFCQGIDQDFLTQLDEEKPTTMRQLNRIWYGYENAHPQRYCGTRYRGVNLHALWRHRTSELRFFNSTLHAGKVKAYIQFALALAAKAQRSRATSSKRREFNSASAKYDFRCFLQRLGLIGDEFKTARLHLLSSLGGSAAWKNGRPTREAA